MSWLNDWEAAAQAPKRTMFTAGSVSGVGVGAIVYADSGSWLAAAVGGVLSAGGMVALCARQMRGDTGRPLSARWVFPTLCVAAGLVLSGVELARGHWNDAWIGLPFLGLGATAIAAARFLRRERL